MILDKIVMNKKVQLENEKKLFSIEDWKKNIETLNNTKDFYGALADKKMVSIIAEIKKASPSKGVIKEDFNPYEIAKDYEEAKVQAVSILTEKKFFLGDDTYIEKIRKKHTFPILRKDFVIDEWQIYQSRSIGADAVLLIAAILDDEKLLKFYKLAKTLGLNCLVEVHDKEELKRVLNIDVDIIGINNRNLKTFEVDLKNTENLLNYIPKGKIVVSESGIKDKEDLVYLKKLGVDAVLIGESFMRAGSIVEFVNDMKNI